jgi:peroxiredoxin
MSDLSLGLNREAPVVAYRILAVLRLSGELPRSRQLYIEADDASTAIVVASMREPLYRVVGVELSDLPLSETRCA